MTLININHLAVSELLPKTDSNLDSRDDLMSLSISIIIFGRIGQSPIQQRN